MYNIPEGTVVYSAVGCELCNSTGYRGRTGIHELLVVDEEVQRLIHASSGEAELEKYAIAKLGMRTLRMDAIRYIIDGKTSIEEVAAVTKD